MVDTIIKGKMDAVLLIKLINEHYKPEDEIEVWARIHKSK